MPSERHNLIRNKFLKLQTRLAKFCILSVKIGLKRLTVFVMKFVQLDSLFAYTEISFILALTEAREQTTINKGCLWRPPLQGILHLNVFDMICNNLFTS